VCIVELWMLQQWLPSICCGMTHHPHMCWAVFLMLMPLVCFLPWTVFKKFIVSTIKGRVVGGRGPVVRGGGNEAGGR